MQLMAYLFILVRKCLAQLMDRNIVQNEMMQLIGFSLRDERYVDTVDVILTDIQGRVMFRSMGYLDFYASCGPQLYGGEPNDPGSCNL
ncbi:GL10913 [Drosophila persimilis]|uniref:GL10913 n=1 Tax=Drosophila persimilis TaxID=7234 RepID=B4GCZ5_DROPE|nr:GL10913 [Drosophila persimilis]